MDGMESASMKSLQCHHTVILSRWCATLVSAPRRQYAVGVSLDWCVTSPVSRFPSCGACRQAVAVAADVYLGCKLRFSFERLVQAGKACKAAWSRHSSEYGRHLEADDLLELGGGSSCAICQVGNPPCFDTAQVPHFVPSAYNNASVGEEGGGAVGQQAYLFFVFPSMVAW